MLPQFNPFPEEANVGTQSGDVEEVTPSQLNSRPPVARKRASKATPSGRKLPNFTVDEDKLLVRAWLNMSTDPIVSTGQRAEAY